ncbi:MAG: hypothetical protein IPH13_15930 [Planctomycetes bacterium]|nr:hypothetical protein [Planctomycetota bacterium]MCC7169218.1 hypothetical protein [Planctomycetota bacterium]
MTSTPRSSISVIASMSLVLVCGSSVAKDLATESPPPTLAWPGPSNAQPSACQILHRSSIGRHAILSERGGVVRMHVNPATCDVSVVISAQATDACVVRSATPDGDVGFVADANGVFGVVPDPLAPQGYVVAPIATMAHAGIVRLVGGELGLDGARGLFAIDQSGVVHVVALVPTPGLPLGLDAVRLGSFAPVDAGGAALAVDDLAPIDWDGDPSNETQLVLRSSSKLLVCALDGNVVLQRDANTDAATFAVVATKGGFDGLAWRAVDSLGRDVLRFESVLGADVDVLLGTTPVRALVAGDADGDGDADLLLAHANATTCHIVSNTARAGIPAPTAAFAHYDPSTPGSFQKLVFETSSPTFATPAFAPLYDDWSASGTPVFDVAMPMESSNVIEIRSLAMAAGGPLALISNHVAFGASEYFASSVTAPTPAPSDWSSKGHYYLSVRDAWSTMTNKSHIQVILWHRDVGSPTDEVAVSDTFHAIGPASFPLEVRIDIPEVAVQSGGNWDGSFDDIYYCEIRAVQATGSEQSGFTISAAGRAHILALTMDETTYDPNTAPTTSLEVVLADEPGTDLLDDFCFRYICASQTCDATSVMLVGPSLGCLPITRVVYAPNVLPRLPAQKKASEVNPPRPCGS